jgi:hypothetical protein
MVYWPGTELYLPIAWSILTKGPMMLTEFLPRNSKDHFNCEWAVQDGRGFRSILEPAPGNSFAVARPLGSLGSRPDIKSSKRERRPLLTPESSMKKTQRLIIPEDDMSLPRVCFFEKDSFAKHPKKVPSSMPGVFEVRIIIIIIGWLNKHDLPS